ncbi:hypothetical protein Taro_003859, partial [Colocasia esculenta]|nr:hypothetical protein [Colocasia esculenta]
VLPTLVGRHGELLLREFLRRWLNHNELVKRLSRFFAYLERFYVVRGKAQTLISTGQDIFINVVYEKVKDQVIFSVLSMIHEEREGSLIDGGLLKNILDFYVSMGTRRENFYEQEFEEPMLRSTAAYYAKKAGHWILTCSFSDYINKANGCMRRGGEGSQILSRPQQTEVPTGFIFLPLPSFCSPCVFFGRCPLVHHELFLVYAREMEEKKLSDPLASELVHVEFRVW